LVERLELDLELERFGGPPTEGLRRGLASLSFAMRQETLASTGTSGPRTHSHATHPSSQPNRP
jgi:hypothetical protein